MFLFYFSFDQTSNNFVVKKFIDNSYSFVKEVMKEKFFVNVKRVFILSNFVKNKTKLIVLLSYLFPEDSS